jgi:hypothetical protein
MSHSKICLEQVFKLREDVQLFLAEVRTNTLRHMTYRQAEAFVKVIADIIGTYGLPVLFSTSVVLEQIKKKSRSDWRSEELHDGKQRVWAAFLDVLIQSIGHYSLVVYHIYRSSKCADLHLLCLLDQASTDYTLKMPDFRASTLFFGAFTPGELIVPAKNQVVCEIDACFHLWNCYSKAAEKPNEAHNRFAQSMARMVVKPTSEDFEGLAKKAGERSAKRARRDPFSEFKPDAEDDEEMPPPPVFSVPEDESDTESFAAVPSGGKGLTTSYLGAKGWLLSASAPVNPHHH